MYLKQFCVIFNDGKGKTLLGASKEDIRERYKNVKSVFTMGIKHSKGEKYEQDNN